LSDIRGPGSQIYFSLFSINTCFKSPCARRSRLSSVFRRFLAVINERTGKSDWHQYPGVIVRVHITHLLTQRSLSTG